MTYSETILTDLERRGWLSLNQFSKLIKVSYPTALRMMRNGNIQVVKVGGINRVYKDEILRFRSDGNYSQSRGGE